MNTFLDEAFALLKKHGCVDDTGYDVTHFRGDSPFTPLTFSVFCERVVVSAECGMFAEFKDIAELEQFCKLMKL